MQLREKDMPAGELLKLARRLRALTEGRALLFVNDRVDVALACAVDGVQLGEEGLPPEAARQIVGSRLLIGRSVHSVEGAVEAGGRGADLLVVGAIFPTESHPGAAAAGAGLLREVTHRVGIPVLAIGGVTSENVEAVLKAGAAGAAVIGAIMRSSDPKAASGELMGRMKAAWAEAQRQKATTPA